MTSWMKVFLLAAVCATTSLVSTDIRAETTAGEGSTRANTDKDLSGQGDRSLGDMVDLNTGSLSFSQTDVSLPGNSTLPVAFSRRLDTQRSRSLNNSVSTLALYDWQIDIPRITVTLATSNPWPSNRCSSQWRPPVLNPAPNFYFNGDQYSGGFKIEFPGGSAQMLLPNGNTFAKPTNFVWVAEGNIGVSCTTAKNPDGSSAGEGFTVWLADGTRYDMTLHTVAQALNIRNPPDGDGSKAGPIIYRQVESMLATRGTDRFGNTVTYTYDTAGKLTQISSNDSRTLNIYWTTYNSSPVVDHVTDGTRTWTYGYANNDLATVTRPDGSQWHYSLGTLAQLKPGGVSNPPPGPSGYVGSVTTPYGLTGTFTVNFVDNPWANVPILGTPLFFATASIVSKQLSGPGISTQVWSYNYNGFGDGWYANNGTPGPETKAIEVIDPSGVTTRSTFNINYDWREGQLEKKEVIAPGSSTPIMTTTYSYIQTPPFGSSPLLGGINLNAQRDGGPRRMTAMTTTVNSDVFTTQITAVDAYRNPTAMSESNSFSGVSRNVTMTYQNNSAGNPWVIGAMTGMTVNGVAAAQSTLNGLLQPQDQYMFGLRKSTTQYTADGLPHNMADGLNHTTTLSNFFRGKPQTMLRPDGNSVSMVVNPTGTIASMTDARGNTTSMSYDVLLRPVSMTFPANDTVAWAGVSTGYTTLASSELGVPAGAFRARTIMGRLQKTTYYDAMLRVVLVEMRDLGGAGNTIYMRKTYDALGRVTFMSYPWGSYDAPSGVNMAYDALDRMTAATTTDGVLLKTISYQSGNQMWTTDASGNTTKTSYQAFGMPAYKNALQIAAPAGQTTSMSRDIFGNLLSASQGGITQSWVYDGNYRLCKKNEPETGQTIYSYDADSKMQWTVAGYPGTPSACDNATEPGNATHYTYDVLDRLTLVHYSDNTGDVSMGYDLDGHVTSAGNPTATWYYGYNKRGLLESETINIDGNWWGLGTTYDNLANVLTKTYPDSVSVNYAPDAFGRATSANGTCCSGAPLSNYARDFQYFANGTPASYTLGNGLTVTTSLNSRQVPDTLRVRQGGNALQSLTYGYNNDLDVTSITDNGTATGGADTVGMGYDGLHRLTSASGVWGAYAYGYDSRNNITTRVGGAGGTLTYNYVDGTNRLNSISGITRNYAYDTRGRVQSDGLRGYTWNDADQISVIPGVATYGYDAKGKRIRTVNASTGVIEYTLYDAAGTLMFSQKGGVNTDFVQLNGKVLVEVTSGVPTYLHADLLGSPKMATDGSGNVIWTEHYDPYGSKLNGVADRIGYTGHAFDSETGLTYAQARFYDAAVGRFMSSDPVGFSGADPFNFNRYGYANENPYKFTDPTGADVYQDAHVQVSVYHNDSGGGGGASPGQDAAKKMAQPPAVSPEVKSTETNSKEMSHADVKSGLPDLTEKFTKTLADTKAFFASRNKDYDDSTLSGLAAKLEFFKSQVTDGAKFDLKARGNGYSIQEIGGIFALFNGQVFRFDDFGNFNFGVAARAFNISLPVAELGAGINQIGKGNPDLANFHGYFDHARDTKMIEQGFFSGY